MELKYDKEHKAIYDASETISVFWEKVGLLIDVDNNNEYTVLLKYGEPERVKVEYELMKKLPCINAMYFEVEASEAFAEELNKMISCTGYVGAWLKNNNLI